MEGEALRLKEKARLRVARDRAFSEEERKLLLWRFLLLLFLGQIGFGGIRRDNRTGCTIAREIRIKWSDLKRHFVAA